MPVLSSSSTFVRFSAEAPRVSDLASFLAEVFGKAAFKDPEPLQKEAVGLSSIDDMFDTEFPYASYDKGKYVAFNFRVDERRIPAAVFKQFLHRAEKEYREKNRGKRPHRNEWKDIKEAVELKLLNRILPSPKAFQVIWNPSGKYLLFGSTREKVIDLFLEFFERHFKVYPKPTDALTLALEDTRLGQREKDVLSGLIASRSRELAGDIFLGSEFLVWLWFYSESEEGQVVLDKDTSFELRMGNRIVLEQVLDGKRQKVVCTGPDADFTEARAALKEGKKIKEAEYEILVGENKYLFTIDTRLWSIKGLKTPKIAPSMEDDDPDGRFYEKMFLIEEALKHIDLLYHHFLTFRLGVEWERDIVPEIKGWIESGGLSR